MKCPVCKTQILNNGSTCQHCGFADLHREFINRQDARDWEQCVVIPYREKWEKGILGSDAWLNRIYECSVFHTEIEKKKITTLTLNNEADLNVDDPERFLALFIRDYNKDIDDTLAQQLSKFRNVREISISSEYKGKINVESLNYTIRSIPNLMALAFYGDIDNEILVHIDLSKIEELYVNLQNSFSPTAIFAPVLKSLSVTGCFRGVKKRDAKKIQRKRYDLLGLPSLENLTIKYCSDFDYRSLATLTNLKRLNVYDGSPFDISLTWLSSTYSLEKLSVGGNITSLNGIENQPALQWLDLRHNQVTDIKKLGQLKQLKYIDLGFNAVEDVSALKELKHLEHLDLLENNISEESCSKHCNVPEMILTRLDKDLCEIVNNFIKVRGSGFIEHVYNWMQYWSNKDEKKASLHERRILEKWRGISYADQVKEAVQVVFNSEYTDLCNGKYCYTRKVTHQHKKTYIEAGLQAYPFLKLSEKMKADMNSHSIT